MKHNILTWEYKIYAPLRGRRSPTGSGQSICPGCPGEFVPKMSFSVSHRFGGCLLLLGLFSNRILGPCLHQGPGSLICLLKDSETDDDDICTSQAFVLGLKSQPIIVHWIQDSKLRASAPEKRAHPEFRGYIVLHNHCTQFRSLLSYPRRFSTLKCSIYASNKNRSRNPTRFAMCHRTCTAQDRISIFRGA
jgi:hypothetical protein